MAGLIPFNRRRDDLMSPGFEDFQNMLDDFFADAWPFSRSLAHDTFKIDVQENEKEYIVEAELPGISKEEVDISLNDGKLKIQVTKQDDKEEKNKNYIHRERRYSSMVRNVFLADCDCDGIKAKMESGILNIVVPKKENADTSYKINIE